MDATMIYYNEWKSAFDTLRTLEEEARQLSNEVDLRQDERNDMHSLSSHLLELRMFAHIYYDVLVIPSMVSDPYDRDDIKSHIQWVLRCFTDKMELFLNIYRFYRGRSTSNDRCDALSGRAYEFVEELNALERRTRSMV